MALRLLRRADWAEAVLQETYVVVWNQSAAYRQDDTPPLPWMAAFLREIGLDAQRFPGLPEPDAEDLLVLELETPAGPNARSQPPFWVWEAIQGSLGFERRKAGAAGSRLWDSLPFWRAAALGATAAALLLLARLLGGGG